MAEPFIGEIRMFGGNFAPRGWAFCNGQLLSIAQNTALFSLLGTTYGGNGTTTFALPDLQCRVPMHWGNGAGLTPTVLGQQGGVESVTLLATQMPAHSHQVGCSVENGGSTGRPNGAVLATSNVAIYADVAPDNTMNNAMIAASGGSQPHTNQQPYTCLSFIIALEGIYPSRS